MGVITFERTTKLSQTTRARQMRTMFDVPNETTTTLSWSVNMPLDERDWSVGLIVGPSGAGKSTLLQEKWGNLTPLQWGKPAVVDDFDTNISVEDVSSVCGAVGFNTIPAWMRPYDVLSTGEKFRVEVARRLVETPADQCIVLDEFTSVVDRQVACIAASAVNKTVRRMGRQLVAATCHYDVEDWLQPDWVLNLATNEFRWRSVQPRPTINAEVQPVKYETWRIFAPFHYLTSTLNPAARCWAVFVDEQPVCFAAVLHRPHPHTKTIKSVSRLVTLPDWQGLGLAMRLVDILGGVYRAVGFRFRMYPAHPALIRAFDRSKRWSEVQKAGSLRFKNETVKGKVLSKKRPCAVYQYAGDAAEPEHARELLAAF